MKFRKKANYLLNTVGRNSSLLLYKEIPGDPGGDNCKADFVLVDSHNESSGGLQPEVQLQHPVNELQSGRFEFVCAGPLRLNLAVRRRAA